MNFSIIKIVLVSLVVSFSILGEARKISSKQSSIRILNWWNYLDERVLRRLKEKGFDPDISIYHSNEVALSRLLSKRDNFDIAIVSNINLDLLLREDIFEKSILSTVIKSRNYNRLIMSNYSCIPYMWGTTIYAYDGRTNPAPPNTLKKLKKMESDGFKIGVLDDPFEMSARILGDNIERCQTKNFKDFFSNIGTCGSSFSSSELKLEANNFLTTSDDFLKKEKVAVYTWQGGAFTNLKEAPWLKFSLSENHPVVGADYVCILKMSQNSKKRLSKIKQFVEILTDKKSTELNVEASQYFSPYINHNIGLHPKVNELYEGLIRKMEKSEPIFLTTPSSSEHKEINSWWKKIRYDGN